MDDVMEFRLAHLATEAEQARRWMTLERAETVNRRLRSRGSLWRWRVVSDDPAMLTLFA